MSHKEQQEQISKLRAEEAQLMAGIEVKDRWVLIECWFAFVFGTLFKYLTLIMVNEENAKEEREHGCESDVPRSSQATTKVNVALCPSSFPSIDLQFSLGK